MLDDLFGREPQHHRRDRVTDGERQQRGWRGLLSRFIDPGDDADSEDDDSRKERRSRAYRRYYGDGSEYGF